MYRSLSLEIGSVKTHKAGAKFKTWERQSPSAALKNKGQ